MTEEEEGTLYEFNLYDVDGEFVRRFPCVPPFEQAPWIAVSGTRYFILMEDMTYHEVPDPGVHFLPAIEEKTRADPQAEER